jgi:hypothetical protein
MWDYRVVFPSDPSARQQLRRMHVFIGLYLAGGRVESEKAWGRLAA